MPKTPGNGKKKNTREESLAKHKEQQARYRERQKEYFKSIETALQQKLEECHGLRALLKEKGVLEDEIKDFISRNPYQCTKEFLALTVAEARSKSLEQSPAALLEPEGPQPLNDGVLRASTTPCSETPSHPDIPATADSSYPNPSWEPWQPIPSNSPSEIYQGLLRESRISREEVPSTDYNNSSLALIIPQETTQSQILLPRSFSGPASYAAGSSFTDLGSKGPPIKSFLSQQCPLDPEETPIKGFQPKAEPIVALNSIASGWNTNPKTRGACLNCRRAKTRCDRKDLCHMCEVMEKDRVCESQGTASDWNTRKACLNCRRAKARCDRKDPCHTCEVTGECCVYKGQDLGKDDAAVGHTGRFNQSSSGEQLSYHNQATSDFISDPQMHRHAALPTNSFVHQQYPSVLLANFGANALPSVVNWSLPFIPASEEFPRRLIKMEGDESFADRYCEGC